MENTKEKKNGLNKKIIKKSKKSESTENRKFKEKKKEIVKIKNPGFNMYWILPLISTIISCILIGLFLFFSFKIVEKEVFSLAQSQTEVTTSTKISDTTETNTTTNILEENTTFETTTFPIITSTTQQDIITTLQEFTSTSTSTEKFEITTEKVKTTMQETTTKKPVVEEPATVSTTETVTKKPVKEESTTISTDETTTKKSITKKSVTASTTEKVTEAKKKSNSISYPLSYSDDGVNITINKKWYINTYCYVAHIQLKNYSRLKTAAANNSYGSTETTSDAASRLNAIFCVNGDYAEGVGYTVLRNNVKLGNSSIDADAFYSQTNGIFSPDTGANTDSFKWAVLVKNSKCIWGRKDGGKSTQRTLIGTTGTPGDIYIVVTEGRYVDGVSKGLQYYEAGDLMAELGCSFAMALDGGGSSTIVFNGQRLNSAQDGAERPVSGFVYITK